MIRLRWKNRSVSRSRRVVRLSGALRPVAAIGAASAGLFLGTALVTDGAEPVLAPPASDTPATVVPLFPPAEPAGTPTRSQGEAVQLLPPVTGNEAPPRVSRIDPDVDSTRNADGPAVPQLTPPPPVPAADVPPAQRPSTPIVERAEMLQRDKEQRFDRLRGQLQNLIEKWEEQQKQLRDQQAQMQSQRAAASPSGTPPTASSGASASSEPGLPGNRTTDPESETPRPSAATTATQTAEAPQQSPAQPRPEQTPADQTQTGQSPPGQTQTLQRPTSVPLPPEAGDDTTGMRGLEDLTAGPVVAEGPIDRLGLADSLFASGENTLALELYRQLESSSDSLESHDRYWVRYQIGCCYRRLNNIDEAQKWYRGIVADKEAGWVGELARWWLDHLEERFRMRGDAQVLQQTMQALEKQVNEQLNTTN